MSTSKFKSYLGRKEEQATDGFKQFKVKTEENEKTESKPQVGDWETIIRSLKKNVVALKRERDSHRLSQNESQDKTCL